MNETRTEAQEDTQDAARRDAASGSPSSYEQRQATLEDTTVKFVVAMNETARKRLLIALINKRAYDGINGRVWDASAHLEWDTKAAAFSPPTLSMSENVQGQRAGDTATSTEE